MYGALGKKSSHKRLVNNISQFCKALILTLFSSQTTIKIGIQAKNKFQFMPHKAKLWVRTDLRIKRPTAEADIKPKVNRTLKRLIGIFKIFIFVCFVFATKARRHNEIITLRRCDFVALLSNFTLPYSHIHGTNQYCVSNTLQQIR